MLKMTYRNEMIKLTYDPKKSNNSKYSLVKKPNCATYL